MNPCLPAIGTLRQRWLPLLERLAAIYGDMDRAYAAVADQYGFQCTGCADNCCLTRFHHHTLLEYLYLAEGLRHLAVDRRQQVTEKAFRVNTELAAADSRNAPIRSMCPLNRNGRCLTYTHRPMICRLHGIPHELHRPGGGCMRSPGCDEFFNQCRQGGKTDYIRFDRTPYYRSMALLERELRQATAYPQKLKFTIAQMMATMTEPLDEND